MRLSERPFFQSYFGIPNFGDELLSRAVVGLFDVAGTGRVASRRPRISRVTLRATGARTVLGKFPHRGFWVGLPLRLWYLSRSTQVFIGGGGVIQDVYSTATIMSSTFDVCRAVLHGIPFAFVGIEIGDIKASDSRARAEFSLQHAAIVWCRDQQSLERAVSLGAAHRALLAPDISHSFLRTWPSAPWEDGDRDHCVMNVRLLPKERPEEFRTLVAHLAEKYSRVTLASAQPGEEREWLALLRERPANIEVFTSGEWKATLELLDTASLVIAERFHFIAAGAHLGVPVVPVLATHKATALADEMEISHRQIVHLSDYTHDRMLHAVEAASPVSTHVLDALAARVNAAVRTTRLAMSTPRAYTPEATMIARRMSSEVLRAGISFLLEGVGRRIRRR